MNFSKKSKSIELPTKSELDVLQILWANGPSTVRTVNDTLNEKKGKVQYTTTLKVMQLMTEKGMLERDETNMKHLYMPVMEEKKTKSSMLDRFVDSVYDGSVSKLLIGLLGNNKTSKKELEIVKQMLNKLDKGK